MGTLYIVATPIGNLKDITLRAIEVLCSVDVIACEDTRKTGFLLKNIQETAVRLGFRLLDQPNSSALMSYYEENEYKRIPEVITALGNGLSVALVSDAGTPLISDPGFKLVRECLLQGIRVVSVPGPSSVTSALVASGLPTDKFLFVGYLPRKGGNRNRLLESLKSSQKFIKLTVVLFEAPHRLIQTLGELGKVFGDIKLVLVREQTKVHEEILGKKISEFTSYYETVSPKGEFVILFHYGE